MTKSPLEVLRYLGCKSQDITPEINALIDDCIEIDNLIRKLD